MASMMENPRSSRFEFIHYSGCAGHDQRNALTKIKKHVMRDYVARKNESCKLGVTREVPAPKAHHPGNKPCSWNPKLAYEKTVRNLPTGRACRLNDTTARVDTAGALERPFATRQSEHHERIVNDAGSKSLGVNAMDPFGTLPLQDAPTELLYWHFALCDCHMTSAPRLNIISAQWAQLVWHSSFDDPALFHIMLSAAERNRLVATHSSDATRYLSYKGKALQALRKKFIGIHSDRSLRMADVDHVVDEPKKISDSLVFSITSQLNHALVEGDLATCEAHLQAAENLINPLQCLLGVVATVHAALMDVKLAAILLRKPRLDVIGNLPSLLVTSNLDEFVKASTLASLHIMPPGFPIHIAETALSGMHLVALVYDPHHASSLEAIPLLACFIRTQHLLSCLVADACKSESQGRLQRTSRPGAAIVLCLEFFAWAMDPAMVNPWISHASYLKRLAIILLRELIHVLGIHKESRASENDIVTMWKDANADLRSLLWVLFIGNSMVCIANAIANDPIASPDFRPASSMLLQAMRIVMRDLEIHDMPALAVILKIMPWNEVCGNILMRLVGTQVFLDASAQPAADLEWPPRNMRMRCHGSCPGHHVRFHMHSPSDRILEHS